MKLFTKIIREVLKQFYCIFYIETTSIMSTINNILNILNKDVRSEFSKTVYFLEFVIIVFCIVIGLFASNYHVRSIAIPITGGFLIYELISLIILVFLRLKKNHNEQKIERLIDNSINIYKIEYCVEEDDYLSAFTLFNLFAENLEEFLDDYFSGDDYFFYFIFYTI
ncbi:hypothetical protein A0H76_1598 [Hepatospora eriocheir]|uniref:Uncharacterized protein n=1 Tax=Hepatospora eriocheir TaxID=1081669 RepID=A0A1X0QGS9_9MICR|nr:hypothetical protein A0H76_1598 [Hepatospora eriocheir]